MSTQELLVPPPLIVDRPIAEEKLCGPGPCNIWPSVYQAMTKPVLYPAGYENCRVQDDIRAGLQYLFQTKSKMVLAISGSGHAGMEAVITNLVAPGETMLVANRGMWDERALEIARRQGITTVVKNAELGTTFTIPELEAVIQRLRPAALFITYGDSSTGTVQNLVGLGDVCHKYGTLLLVDTVVAIGGIPFFMDAWGVDGVYAAAQKALSGPAGIAPVAFSPLAEQKIRNRKHTPSFYFDVQLLAEQWDCYGERGYYHHTMSPPLLWALRACLQELCQETLPVSWARHEAARLRLQTRLQNLPVSFFAKNPEDRLNTVTTFVIPPQYDHKEFLKYIREKHGIVIFGGIGPTAGKCLRVGIMGINANLQIADAVSDAIEDALRVCSKSKL